MGPRAKSIDFAWWVQVLQSDTAVARMDAVPQAASAQKTGGHWHLGRTDEAHQHIAPRNTQPFKSFQLFSNCSIDAGRDVCVRFRSRTGDSAVLTMSFAVEFLSGPRVLMLRVYAGLTPPERRTAIEIIRLHGCYRQGVPLLLDCTETTSSDWMTDLDALRTALASAFGDSPIAIVVKAGGSLPDQAVLRGGPVFTVRADALRWLTTW